MDHSGEWRHTIRLKRRCDDITATRIGISGQARIANSVRGRCHRGRGASSSVQDIRYSRYLIQTMDTLHGETDQLSCGHPRENEGLVGGGHGVQQLVQVAREDKKSTKHWVNNEAVRGCLNLFRVHARQQHRHSWKCRDACVLITATRSTSKIAASACLVQWQRCTMQEPEALRGGEQLNIHKETMKSRGGMEIVCNCEVLTRDG